MRKRVVILAIQAFLLFTLLVGTTNAWFVDEESAGTAALNTANIKAEIEFELKYKDSQEKVVFAGIPGESMILSQKNEITDTNSTREYIYKATYVLEDSDGVIEKLFLTGEKENLKESYDSTSKTLVVYGLHSISDDDTVKLPELAAEFKILRNIHQEKGFSVTANLEYCQSTKEAAKDYFNLSESEFTNIINRIGGGSVE